MDARLVAGSALFGVGWSIAGACPGPAIANLALPLFGGSIGASVAPFVAAMALSMALVNAVEDKCGVSH